MRESLAARHIDPERRGSGGDEIGGDAVISLKQQKKASSLIDSQVQHRMKSPRSERQFAVQRHWPLIDDVTNRKGDKKYDKRYD